MANILVDKVTYYDRLQICMTCDSFQKFLNRCRECGCVMPFKAKFVKSNCPLDKWRGSSPSSEPTEESP